MRLPTVMAKLLVILLTLRMVAAPVALRPLSSNPHSCYHLVARVCAWSAQRPRCLPASVTFRNRTPFTGFLRTWFSRVAPHSMVMSALHAAFGRIPPRNPLSAVLTGCLRC